MVAYAPKSGTVAHVAVADEETFGGCRWDFGGLRISEAFGDNVLVYQDIYELRVTEFEDIRDQPFHDLTEVSLNERRTQLREALRERLRAWIKDFQDCEAMIRDFEQGSLDSRQVVSGQDESKDSTQVPPDTSPNGGSNPHLSGQTGGNEQLNGSNPIQPSEFKPLEDPSKLRRNLRRLFRRLTRRKKHSNQGVQGAKNALVEASPEVVNGAPASTNTMIPQDPPSSTAADLWEKRFDLIELLEVRLPQHYLFFSLEIEPRRPQAVSDRLLEEANVARNLTWYQSVGRTLQTLINSLGRKRNQSHMAFQLMLHNNPFNLRSALCGHSSACESYFRRESAAFYLRVACNKGALPRPEHVASPLFGPSRSIEDEEKFFAFGVSENDEEVGPGTEIHDLASLFEPSTTERENLDWGTFYGHIDGSIRIVSDSTSHLRQKSFVDHVADTEEKRMLKKSSYAAMRAQLAFVVASSLFFKLQAEGLQDVAANRLLYHTKLDSRRNPHDICQSLVLPFISLDTIGCERALPSSVDALTSSTQGKPEERMMQNLGILIYEIGAWDTVTDSNHGDRVLHTRHHKDSLCQVMTSRYRDVIRDCLGFQYQGKNEMEKWMIQKVINPLDEISQWMRKAGLK